jgi:hypothetical protein
MNGNAIPEQVYMLIEEYNVLRRMCRVEGNAFPGANWPLRPSDIQWLQERLATIRSALTNLGYIRFVEGN